MNKELRVLQLIDSLNVGGAEVLAVNIFNLLSNNNDYKSYICATRQEGDLQSKIIQKENYFFLRKKYTVDLGAIYRLRKFVKKNEINIIHAHSTSFFMAFCMKFVFLNVKVIWHDHYGNSDFLNERNFRSLKFVSNKFDFIISVNSKLVKWSNRNLHCKRVMLLNNFAYFNDLETNTILKGEQGKRIVHLAAFRTQKDHLNLLKSFLITQNEFADWTLHLVGDGNDEKYKNEIVSFINANQLESKVFLYGVCLDIKNILSQATIGVLASKSEGLPIALLEYGLAKLPVIVTNVGQCNDVVKNDVSGHVIPKNDSKKLAESIIYLINNEKKRSQFGEELYLEVKNNYSKESYVNKLTEIYREVLC